MKVNGAKSIIIFLHCLLVIAVFMGCGREKKMEQAVITIPHYEIMEHETVLAKKKDVTPKITLELKPKDYNVHSYSVDDENLELDKLEVSVGDEVKKGEILASFQSDELSEELKEYEAELRSGQLKLEHLRRLNEIDSKDSYKNEILNQSQELSIIELKIEDCKRRLSGYSLVADENGVVTQIDEEFSYGYVSSDVPLIQITSASNEYEAVCEEEYPFSKGELYTARFGSASYKMKVTSVDRSNGEMHINFIPVRVLKEVSVTDTLTMTLKKHTLKQVICVPISSVFSKDNIDYVKVVDEQGFPTVIEVKTGSRVSGTEPEQIVIEQGLKGGERIVVQ